MRYACLIPTTGRDSLNDAVYSAEQDGWEVFVLEDKEHLGSIVMRNRLLNSLDSDVPTLVRYLDDDDKLLPHREVVAEKFKANPNLELIYTDNVVSSKLYLGTYLPNRLSGDPLADLLGVNPWTWIARLDVLNSLQKLNGFIWDESDQCLDGLTCWYRFLKAELNIKHLPIEAYQYNKGRFKECITNKPIGPYGLEVINQLKKYKL